MVMVPTEGNAIAFPGNFTLNLFYFDTSVATDRYEVLVCWRFFLMAVMLQDMSLYIIVLFGVFERKLVILFWKISERL